MDEGKTATKHAHGTEYSSCTLTLSPRRLRRTDAKNEVDYEQSQESEFEAETKRELERQRTYDQRLRFAEQACHTMALKLSTEGNIALLILLVGGRMALEYVVLPYFHIVVQAIYQAILWILLITFVTTYSLLMLFFLAEVLTGESSPHSSFDTKTSDRQQLLSVVPTGLQTHSAMANVVASHEISHQELITQRGGRRRSLRSEGEQGSESEISYSDNTAPLSQRITADEAVPSCKMSKCGIRLYMPGKRHKHGRWTTNARLS